jgi:hypothetical protein
MPERQGEGGQGERSGDDRPVEGAEHNTSGTDGSNPHAEGSKVGGSLVKNIVDIILGRRSDTQREQVISTLYRQGFDDIKDSREKLITFQRDLDFLKAKIARKR